MIRNIGKYFLFFFFFVFTLSLVNISPLFAKKEKEADKTAVDTAVCKRDATKTGAEQYSETCKTQCTSKETKFSQFQKENKAICDLFPPLSAIDSNANTKEQEIESLVQDVVEKLNKIEDTAENTAALEAIIPDFPSPTSKEFTITFSDKLRIVLEAIIFPQSVPESTATIAFVLNEATTTPETPEKTPGTTPETAEKTPIQARAEAAIKTIILKSFDPLTDTATGKYYKEVIQELRDHWLNVDLKGDYKAKDTPFTVDNFKSAIFGSIGYSLPHELYHFEFDEALTKAIKDHAEADTAKKAFVEAYKKYIETNTKIEIQSNSWEEGKSLEFKISLNAGDALLDPGIKCTDAKFTQFQKDNAEVCKLVAVAAKAATDSGTAESEAKKAEAEKVKAEAEKTTAEREKGNAEKATTSTDALAFAKLSDTAATKADTAATNAKTALTNAKAARDRIPTTDTVNRGKADAAVTAAEGFATAARTASDQARTAATKAAGYVINKAKAEAINAQNAAWDAANSTAALVEAKKTEAAAKNAETALLLIPEGATNREVIALTVTSVRLTSNSAAEAVITKANDEASTAENAAAAQTSTLALGFAQTAAQAANNAEAALLLIPVGATNREATAQTVTGIRTDANSAAVAVITKAQGEATNAKIAAEAAQTSTLALPEAQKAATAANNADAALLLIPGSNRPNVTGIRNASNEASLAVIDKAQGEAISISAQNAADSTLALVEAKKADKAADNAEEALLLIPQGATNREATAQTVTNLRTDANEAALAVINKAQTAATPARTSAEGAATSTLALPYAQTADTEADNAEEARDLIPATDATRETANTNAGAVRTLANEAALAVINRAYYEALAARNAAQGATDSTQALVEAKKADKAADRAEEALKLIPEGADNRDEAADRAEEARSLAGSAARYVITKAEGEAEAEKTKANAAGTSTLALPFARTADQAADNAEEALLLIPAADRGANTQAVTNIRNASNNAPWHVISKALTEAFNARDAAEGADNSTLALGFAQKAAQAATNAEAALNLIPQGIDSRYLDESDVSNIRTASNDAAQAVINKAKGEAQRTPGNAQNAQTSTLALVEAKKADNAADNAEEALKLIPTDAPNRATLAQYAADVRTAANTAAQAVITKAKGEALGFSQTADTEHTNVTNAAGNRATALAAAGRARTAADNAAASAKNAEEARDLIPATDPARAIANTDAGHARTSATDADNFADAAEAAVPN